MMSYPAVLNSTGLADIMIHALLAQMGVELVNISAMLDEPERLFSSAKLLISD
jgi:hypothetical protein